jgi:hypothetical protein
MAVSEVQSEAWLQRRTMPVPDAGYLQVVASDGGLSLHEAAHDAARAVAVHFGGRSFATSGAVVMCAQQMGADPGQSEAVEHASVAFEAHEEAAPHVFVWALRFAQQIWLPLHRTRLARGPQLGPGPVAASMTGATESGPESMGGGGAASDCASAGISDTSVAASPAGEPSSGCPSLASLPGVVCSGFVDTSSADGVAGVEASDTEDGLSVDPSQSAHSL